MTTILRLATAIMLIPGAVWAGIIVCYAVERTNLWRRMPLEQYATDFRRSLRRVDPLQPVLLLVTAVGATVFTLNANGPGEALAWAGIGLLAVVRSCSPSRSTPSSGGARKASSPRRPRCCANAGRACTWCEPC